jgi:hypothetical protein
MPKITVRRNGEIYGVLEADAAQFAKIVREKPEDLISRALMMPTGDPERPGRVLDWLLPGWKFDVDYRCDTGDRLIEIVVNVFEPKRRH